MNLNSVSTNEGYVWVRQGVWLFKQNPLGFLMLVFMYVFIAQLAVMIPLAGVFAVLILTPALSVGFMTACRQTIQKERILPTAYLAAFRSNNPEVKKRILQLGLVYAVMIFALSLIASMVIDFQALLPFVTNDKPITPEVMQTLYYSLMIGGVIYIPIAMLMWFAPVLVAWADMPPSKAMFASWMACWTNKGAFFLLHHHLECGSHCNPINSWDADGRAWIKSVRILCRCPSLYGRAHGHVLLLLCNLEGMLYWE